MEWFLYLKPEKAGFGSEEFADHLWYEMRRKLKLKGFEYRRSGGLSSPESFFASIFVGQNEWNHGIRYYSQRQVLQFTMLKSFYLERQS